MRTARHEKILEIIGKYPITTQEELLDKLKETGIPVTQATISRDIKYLRLVKTLDEDGFYHYISMKAVSQNPMSGKFIAILREAVISMDCAVNILCVKCHTGMANAACATIDSLKFENIVGTISGDDTIFILLKSAADANELKNVLVDYLEDLDGTGIQ